MMRSLDELVSRWVEFVAECETSYQGDLDEYYNFIGLRSMLSDFFANKRIIAYPDVVDCIFNVVQADRRLVALLDHEQPIDVARDMIDDGTAWYWHFFPRYCGPALAQEIHANYQITLEVRGG
ncbi:hypothetical protein JQS43_18585 [Natronosporangium hydrolyticum]|uniref:Uncharacterized protein n=1 Tax=Natronosporangium hydrolyticum TaxID=2811111 RepID=A0A895YTK1_9ACTN|nr:hypothetical protein JQS43_18585 [Natronosporangium hydrolyticum]